MQAQTMLCASDAKRGMEYLEKEKKNCYEMTQQLLGPHPLGGVTLSSSVVEAKAGSSDIGATTMEGDG